MPLDQSAFWVTQWALVVDAPLPFLACLVSAIGVIWFLVNWGYRRETEALKQQIAAAQQTIELFKSEIPVLAKEIHQVETTAERREPCVAICKTAGDAAVAIATLRNLQPDLLIPVRNRPTAAKRRPAALTHGRKGG